jgi:hypothetical protein
MTILELYNQAKQYIRKPIPVKAVQMEDTFDIKTIHGVLQGKKGDWVIIDKETEVIYVCEDYIFQKIYMEFKENG